LSSRGVTLGAVALPIAAGSFVGSTAQAAVAFAAGSSQSPASSSVLALANGATKTMTSTLLKLTAAAAVLCSVTAGVWGFTNSPEPQDAKASPPVVLAPAAAAAPNQKDDAKPGERLADARQRQQTMNSLKQVMLAIFNHHDAMGQFPVNIVDKNGKALLSWRVAILPYIEQETLYKQFKLDEPWDSDHNKKLIAQMPPIYRIGFQEKDATKTYFQVFAGPGTAFEPGKKITIATITDGTSNTLGPIVAGPAVEWTKPADIAYDAKKPFPKLDGPFKNVLLAAMMDGSVRTMNPRMKIEEFRKLVECADGNPIDPNASAVEIKPVTKEDKELLGKLLKENEELSKKVSELLIERTKLVILTMRKQNATTADLDRVMREHDDLERAIEHLTDEIKKLKENSEKK
ncbi:MAG TPA: DUF1559 domain-containing protein, partial [Gemmata sp.]|nr:DUF1559 domain-containing protein [Gemmata sp.]